MTPLDKLHWHCVPRKARTLYRLIWVEIEAHRFLADVARRDDDSSMWSIAFAKRRQCEFFSTAMEMRWPVLATWREHWTS